MRHSARLRAAADYSDRLHDEIQRLRFCRNVQRTQEADEAENARRLRQLLEAVDSLLQIEAKG